MAEMVERTTAYEIVASLLNDHKAEEADQDKYFTMMVQACPIHEINNEYYYLYSDLKLFLRNVSKWIEEKDSSLLRRQVGYKVKRIVDIIEFVESTAFMSMKGSVYPAVKDALWELWRPDRNYHEAVLSGSTGTGKSFILEMSMGYMLYMMSVLIDPQAELDLAPGSPLFFVFQSGNTDQARNILFRPFHTRVSRTKYFTEVFPFRKDVTSELVFPNGVTVKPFSGSDDAVLGLTVVGAGITELNRMALTKRSSRQKYLLSVDQTYDQALSIYRTIVRRMVSRTMQLGGKLWGKVILDAAHEHEDDFTSNKIREAATNKKIFIYKKKQWEVLPKEKFSGDVFYVEVGDHSRRARILKDKKQAIEGSQIEEVPVEYKTWFDQDVEGALRDFGGIVSSGQRPAIPFREKIHAGYEEYNKLTNGIGQLFKYDTIVLSDYRVSPGAPEGDWDAIINWDYVDEVLIDKSAVFAGHVDPALNHCNAGLAVGHIRGWKLLPTIKEYDHHKKRFIEKHNVRAPLLMVDGMIAIAAPYGEEIDLELLQHLGIYLAHELKIGILSIDSYQSAQMVQAWKIAGMVTGNVSVDDTVEPYTRVKNAYRDERLITYRHAIYDDEIRNLQMDNGKYDHLAGKSKDCSDAVAGTVYLLETHVGEYQDDSIYRNRRPGQRYGRRLAMRRR